MEAGSLLRGSDAAQRIGGQVGMLSGRRVASFSASASSRFANPPGRTMQELAPTPAPHQVLEAKTSAGEASTWV